MSSTEHGLVTNCLESMRFDPDSLREARLLAGGSGSAVVRLGLDGPVRDTVLKVTTAAAWRARAERELRFLAQNGERLPIGVPEVLGTAISDHYVCLLVRSEHALPASTDWPNQRWTEIAADLGTLHRKRTLQTIDATDCLVRRTPAVDPNLIEPALAYWHDVERGPLATFLLREPEALTLALTAVPSCLLHGDCHPDNLLVDEHDRVIFADWQEVGIGHGPEDLAMLWQRAEAAGAEPPREELLATYASARQLGTVDEALRRATIAAELLLLLVQWPPHLVHLVPERREALTHRLDQLAAGWSTP